MHLVFVFISSFVVKYSHRGHLAQLARASRLHREGRGFESLSAHHSIFVRYTAMKYITLILALLVFFSFSFSSLNSQVLDSDYVRESERGAEVLGVLGEEDVEEEIEIVEDDDDFVENRIIELSAIIGGVILVLLFAYIVYGRKVNK